MLPPVSERWQPNRGGGRPRGKRQPAAAQQAIDSGGDEWDAPQLPTGDDDIEQLSDAGDDACPSLRSDSDYDSEPDEDPKVTSQRATNRQKFIEQRPELFRQFVRSKAVIEEQCGPTPGALGAYDYQALVLGDARGSCKCPGVCRGCCKCPGVCGGWPCKVDAGDVRWQPVLVVALEGSQLISVPVFTCPVCETVVFNVHPFAAACFPSTADHGISLGTIDNAAETPTWFAMSTLRTISELQLKEAPAVAEEAFAKVIRSAARDNKREVNISTLQHALGTVLEEFAVLKTRAEDDPTQHGVKYPMTATDLGSACSACDGNLNQVYLDGHMKSGKLLAFSAKGAAGAEDAGLRGRFVPVEVRMRRDEARADLGFISLHPVYHPPPLPLWCRRLVKLISPLCSFSVRPHRTPRPSLRKRRSSSGASRGGRLWTG